MRRERGQRAVSLYLLFAQNQVKTAEAFARIGGSSLVSKFYTKAPCRPEKICLHLYSISFYPSIVPLPRIHERIFQALKYKHGSAHHFTCMQASYGNEIDQLNSTPSF